MTAALAVAATVAHASTEDRAIGPKDVARANSHRPLPRVIVHPEGHYLAGDDGSPFFWLGDTAWQLIQSTTRPECSYYLHTRARQGFTVIQTVVLAEFGGVKQPTALGLVPFKYNDPKLPNYDFFDRVVQIVDEAAQYGLYVALLPSWGDKLTAPWGEGPRLFRNDNLGEAEQYGRYLAGKLKDRTNVLWVLGGDRPPRVKGATANGSPRLRKLPDSDPIRIGRRSGARMHPGSRREAEERRPSSITRKAAWSPRPSHCTMNPGFQSTECRADTAAGTIPPFGR